MRLRVLILLCAIVFTVPVLANPISIYPTPWGETRHEEMFHFIAAVSLLLEYVAIRLLLGRQFSLLQGLLAFVVINLITFPLTTLVSGGIQWYAEVIPLVLEPLMFLFVAGRLQVKVPYLGAKVVGANLLSFAAGFVLFYVLEIVY